jgi:hypothetical protein
MFKKLKFYSATVQIMAIIILAVSSVAAFKIAAERVYYKDLRKYILAGDRVPTNLKALDGKQVSIVGYMIPFDSVEKINRFILLQAQFMGCFHVPPPQPNEVVMVDMGSRTVDYSEAPLQVNGLFQIKKTYEEDFLISVFTVKNAQVKTAKGNDVEMDGLPSNFHLSEF